MKYLGRRLKHRKINTIDSSVCVLWKPVTFYYNIPKYNYMLIDVLIVFPVVLVFCKMNVSIVKSSKYDYWFSESLGWYSMGRWLSGRCLVGWWVGGPWIWWNPGKNMFEVVISPMQFGRGLFCYSNFIFLHIEHKEKTNLIARSSHSNF